MRSLFLALIHSTPCVFAEDHAPPLLPWYQSNPSIYAEDRAPAFPAWSGPLYALHSWGKISDGLQMAACPDAEFALIHVWIRNALASDINYNDYYLGYFDCLLVEVKRGEKWQRLERRTDTFRCYAGAGPETSDNKTLTPLQIIPKRGLIDDRERFYIFNTLENLRPSTAAIKLLLGHTFRKDLLRPSLPHVTLSIDLADFNWPREFLNGEPLTLRVIQELAPALSNFNTGYKNIQIASTEMQIKSIELNAFFARLAKANGAKP